MSVRLPDREVKRSFLLNVINGALFEFAERLIDPPLVLTWFVSQLTTSHLLIGLVAPLGQAGWYLPQIFVSARVQSLPKKMPSYAAAALVRVASWFVLGLAVWFTDEPVILLGLFFPLFALARTVAGLGGLAFFEVTGKTIPAWRRGSLFAWRQFLGGLLGLSAGWIVNTLLTHPMLPFPRGHATLFLLYGAVITPALAAFIAVREPPGPAYPRRLGLAAQIRRAAGFLKRDRVFRAYILAQTSLALSGMSVPFYAVYAKTVLGAPDKMVGIYISTRVAAQLIFNLPWGALSDRKGNRLALRLLCLSGTATTLLAIALVGGVALFRPQGAWVPYLLLPLYVIDGASRPAMMITGSNFLLELAPEEERPLYLGFSNTLMGFVVLAGAISGLLVDVLGFAGLFAVCMGLSVLAYAAATSLPEPRRRAVSALA